MNIKKIDIKTTFEKKFDWHYDPTLTDTNDAPYIGVLNGIDFEKFSNFVIDLCSHQDPITSRRGWSAYLDNDFKNVDPDTYKDKDDTFLSLMNTWQQSNCNKYNSCYYEFYDNELQEFEQIIKNSFTDLVGDIKDCFIRVSVKPPMTGLILHADTYNSYSRKHNVDTDNIVRYITTIEPWEWGHYLLIGNECIHQWKSGETYQIKPNVFHCTGNFGFNPKILLTITGHKRK